MRSPLGLALALSLVVVAGGCGDDSAGSDAGVRSDAGSDAGTPDDASGPRDAGSDAGDAGSPPGVPDRRCPGSAGCADEGDGTLSVGAAMQDITPTISATTDVQTVDVNGNGEYNPEDGDEFDDRNHNGAFDGVWISNSNGRAASGAHDPQWARAIVLRRNQTTIALVSVDMYGYFIDQVDQIRESLRDADVDYVLVSSTHSHSARDTLGINGLSVLDTGLDPAYMIATRARIAQAVRDGIAALRPAHVQYARLRLRDEPGGMLRYTSDLRPPIVIDDEVRIMRFTAASDDSTIATFVNWGQHQEAWPGESQMLSSDMFNWLRDGVEHGAMGPDGAMAPGVGGIAVAFQGASGANIGPLDAVAQTWDGTMVPGRQGEMKAEVLGRQVAWYVLHALGPDGGSVTDESADPIAFRSRRVRLKLQNRRFHVAFIAGLFGDAPRPSYDWDPDAPLIPGRNEPWFETEIAVVDIGRASILSIPGELDPDLWVGGYDGAFAPPGVDVNPPMVNAPDLAMAPDPPYLRDLLMMRAGAEYGCVVTLSNDQLGYFLPSFNYVLNPTDPYIDEADGEHYDETYSIGVDAWPTLQAQLEPLLTWRPPAGGM